MKLLTKAIEKAFTKQGYTGDKEAKDVKAIARFFNPNGSATWYATEFDPITRNFFGYVNLGDPQCAELGYFNLDELQSIRTRFGLGIERDMWFEERTLEDVMNDK